MPENENQPPVPSKQTSSVPLTKQTSSVPLKKETVRVTLKAADAPPAVPSATMPISPPVRPPVPGAPPVPTAPAPTIPLRPVGSPTAAPAPTIRLASSSATSALRPGGGAPTLPKATVQLQAPTQPLGTSFPTAQVSSLKVEDDEEEEANAGLNKILAGLGFAAAVAVLVSQGMIAKTWISVDDPDPAHVETNKAGDWLRLIQ